PVGPGVLAVVQRVRPFSRGSDPAGSVMRFSRLVDHRDMASLREPPEFTTKLSMSSSAHAHVGNGTSVEGKQTANHGDRPFRTVLVGLRRAHLFVRPSVGTYQRRSSDG